jgi:ADP-heptose:LPS heptosyltransferase
VGIERVLVIKVRALGDTLLATPALTALRRGLLGAEITVLVSPAGREVLEGNPDVDAILVYDKRVRGLDYQWRVWRELARRRFDTAVALHASFRTALLARASGAPRRVVHNHSGANFFSTVRIPFKKESKSAIQRDLDAVRSLGLAAAGETLVFPIDAEALRAARLFLAERRMDAGGFLVLIPGAGKERKRWTADAAAAFLDSIARRLPARWVVLAGPADRELAAAIQAKARHRPPVFSQGVKAAGALLSLSRGAVTTDSGPKHIAVAMNVPTLTLWTDEPEAEWHPYDPARHALLRSATGLVADLLPETVAVAVQAHFTQVRRTGA